MPFTGSPFSCLRCRTDAVVKTFVLLCALVAKNVLCFSILRRPFIYLCSVFLKIKHESSSFGPFWTLQHHFILHILPSPKPSLSPFLMCSGAVHCVHVSQLGSSTVWLLGKDASRGCGGTAAHTAIPTCPPHLGMRPQLYSEPN